MLTKKLFYSIFFGMLLILPFAVSAVAEIPQPFEVFGTLTVDGVLISGSNKAYTVKFSKSDGTEYKDSNSQAWSQTTAVQNTTIPRFTSNKIIMLGK